MTKDEALKLALEALEALTYCEALNKDVGQQLKAQPAQESYEISTEELIYAAGVCDGKKQRPWVGLTEDEVMDVFKERNALKFAAAIEAKLKEKNT